jgi:ribosomal protein L11 methyltransferase
MTSDDRRTAGRRTRTAGGNRSWSALVLELPPHLGEEITGCLAGRILGAEHLHLPGGLTRTKLFLRAPSRADRAMEETRRLLRGFGLHPEACRLRLECIDDDDWVERYQAALHPIDLGRRFVVLPGGEGPVSPTREPILLTPGRAFGTGEHATTQLCAEALERRVREGSRWFDLGCGTGILGIVAVHCGAAEVLAVDRDSEAIDVATEVLDANGLAGRIRLRRGSIEQGGGRRWSGIVANIHAPFFHERAAALSGALLPGGLLIASGFTGEQAAEIAVSLEGAGLRGIETRERGPWAVWVGRLADGSGEG